MSSDDSTAGTCGHAQCRPGYVDVRLLLARSTEAMSIAVAPGELDEPAMREALGALVDAGGIMPAIATWALITGEIGVPRLPGGKPAGELHTFEPDYDEPWSRGMVTALRAAAERDGDTMTAALAAVIDGESATSGDSGIPSFLASLAWQAGTSVQAAGADPVHLAVMHAIGAYADSPYRCSGAGVAYRVAGAVLASMGSPGVGHLAVPPEVDAIGELPVGVLVDTALGLATCLADLADEIEPPIVDPRDWRDTSADDERSTSQRACAYALRLVEVCRARDAAAGHRLVADLRRSGVAMAFYALCVLLAGWARQTYGDLDCTCPPGCGCRLGERR